MKKISVVLVVALCFAFTTSRDEEGMFPLSHLSKLDLKEAGLKIDVKDIYNEEGTSLVNALVRLGGCTGSFISDQGLIITNHHCVYGTVASLSTPENNYLENGFYASTTDQELNTTLPCKITKSFEDVSEKVLKGIDKMSSALQREKQIDLNIKAVIAEDKENHPELSIEISEMLVGKSYTLFRYKTLDDVRIVYVPPKNIGKFGGETDNWEWPRHNGDFSIVRAYENGKPYVPEQHLNVNPKGTKAGDFTFILGYPGRTYRNQPAQFLTYQNDYILPIISSWFDFRINAIEEFAGDDEALKLKYSGTLASLSNVTKNFKGKMQGLDRTNVIAKTQREQEELKNYANANKKFNSYVPLFQKSDSLYKRKFELSRDYLYLGQMYNTIGLLKAANALISYQEQTNSMSKKELKVYIEENKSTLDDAFKPLFGIGDAESVDRLLFQELVYQLSMTKLPDLKSALAQEVAGKSKAEVYATAGEMYDNSGLNDYIGPKEEADYIKIFKVNSDFIKFASRIIEPTKAIQSEVSEIDAEINEIIPRFNDIEIERNLGTYVPDANGTLRFTYGYVKGYEPEDAVVFEPFTTVQGIIEKAESSQGNPDYYLQPEIIKKFKETEPADVLKHPENKSVVVGLLYNMDTTGGNSGSPILDAYGNIIGINFDRAFTATINDYAWNESYSRSIGVDIRYVLYVMKYFGNADEVLDEIGVEL